VGVNLTKAVIEQAAWNPEGPKTQLLADEKLIGYYLRLYPGAKAGTMRHKSYAIGYRMPGRAQYDLFVFSKCDRRDPDAARKRAKSLLGGVEDGIDPKEGKRRKRQEAQVAKLETLRTVTVGTLAPRYFTTQERRQKQAEEGQSVKALAKRTLEQYRWCIDAHVLPHWKDIDVSAIGRADVKAWVRKLEASEDMTPSSTNDALTRFRALMAFAVDEDIIASNPAKEVKSDYSYQPRERTLSDDEIRTLWTGLDASEIAKPVQLAYKLLLLTAQRRSEIVEARWSDVDLQQNTLVVPKARVKNRSGANIVPLSPMAQDVLQELRKLTGGSNWLFPSPLKKDAPYTPSTVSNALRQNMVKLGFKEGDDPFHVHDLRRTVATNLAREEVERENIKAILNHTFGDVTEVYITSNYVQQKRRYLTMWAEKLQRILDKTDGENVVMLVNA
jgi:integrase